MNSKAFTRRWFVIVSPLLLTVGVAGLQAQIGDPEGATRRLKSVGIFALGGVGFAGVISKGELDYRAILSEPRDQALKLFEDVFAQGNNQAKCYALTGIGKFDPHRFEELYETVAASDDVVVTMRGCVISSRKLKDVVNGISGELCAKAPQLESRSRTGARS